MNKSTPESIQKLAKLLEAAKAPVFFGGAGVSTESGIPDFRSVDGLYSQKYAYPPEQILSHSFFKEKPSEFYKFYIDKMIITGARPNPAHTFLAEMGIPVITQNIDGLHSLAAFEARAKGKGGVANAVSGSDGQGGKSSQSGTKDAPNYLTPMADSIYELHGSVHRSYCTKCHAFYSLDDLTLLINEADDFVPRCKKMMPADGEIPARECAGVLKPDVVLYEEGLDDEVWSGAAHAIQNCDILMVGGTSLTVYPAASLVRSFRGTHLALLNRDQTTADSSADIIIRDPIGEVFKGMLGE